MASEMVAALRRDAGRHPDDRGMVDLVGELAVRSEEFATWWGDQRVTAHTDGVKRFHHDVVGDLELHWQGLALPGDEDQTIYVYHAPPGSPAAEKLGLLGSWTGANSTPPHRGSSFRPGPETAVNEPG